MMHNLYATTFINACPELVPTELDGVVTPITRGGRRDWMLNMAAVITTRADPQQVVSDFGLWRSLWAQSRLLGAADVCAWVAARATEKFGPNHPLSHLEPGRSWDPGGAAMVALDSEILAETLADTSMLSARNMDGDREGRLARVWPGTERSVWLSDGADTVVHQGDQLLLTCPTHGPEPIIGWALVGEAVNITLAHHGEAVPAGPAVAQMLTTAVPQAATVSLYSQPASKLPLWTALETAAEVSTTNMTTTYLHN